MPDALLGSTPVQVRALCASPIRTPFLLETVSTLLQLLPEILHTTHTLYFTEAAAENLDSSCRGERPQKAPCSTLRTVFAAPLSRQGCSGVQAERRMPDSSDSDIVELHTSVLILQNSR